MTDYSADILIVGGGAAGLSAASEAASYGSKVLIAETDLQLGGQLVKQTHKFFGSKDEYAGTRGYKIAGILLDEIKENARNVKVLTNTTITGYYSEDQTFTAMCGEESYTRIKAKKAIVATGASERLIPFPNNDIPGVYGAGAIQTLMNVYGVTPGRRVLMVGAGNIGLIVSYQLMQAGVEVAAVVEAMPKIGGYWVHAAKIRRLGVPILLRHSIKEALGERVVEGAVIMELDDKFAPTGKEQNIDCDVICLAVGLSPTTEILAQAGCKMRYVPELCGSVVERDRTMRTSNPDFWSAGDATGIEEASAAMVEGRIAGLCAAESLGFPVKTEKLDEYWTRLDHLRAGEVGEKIRTGIGKVSRGEWEV
ncbi:MAG: NAD(P)/FAD-dependent oxidoreductase [Synergistaceae bacterium]|jgi:sarcosine oxidase subunit alpha|nr:NAD(P)/FAD-dependent oxidoreductase [Synergistaceae bacterium]